MSRMIDNLGHAGLKPLPHQLAFITGHLAADARTLLAGMPQNLTQAEVLVIDNVSDYLFSGTTQEYWEWDRDFPCLAPPFPLFWMEYRAPTRIISDVRPDNVMPGTMFHSCGALIQGDAWQQVPQAIQEEIHLHLPPTDSQQPAWMLRLHTFIAREKHWIAYIGTRVSLLDAEGHAIFFGPSPRYRATLDLLPYAQDDVRTALGMLMNGSLMPIALAISFLHCRNVQLVERRPTAKRSHARTRRHGQPYYRYHELVIEPMRRILRTEGRADEVGLRQALHICRGHFKDYRGQGLFGKHHGIYWWDHHLRGCPQIGVVDKHYRVIPAAPQGGLA